MANQKTFSTFLLLFLFIFSVIPIQLINCSFVFILTLFFFCLFLLFPSTWLFVFAFSLHLFFFFSLRFRFVFWYFECVDLDWSILMFTLFLFRRWNSHWNKCSRTEKRKAQRKTWTNFEWAKKKYFDYRWMKLWATFSSSKNKFIVMKRVNLHYESQVETEHGNENRKNGVGKTHEMKM